MNVQIILDHMLDAIENNNGLMKVDISYVLELMTVKQALEFYGNEDNYENPVYDEHGRYNGSWVDKDGGATARVVLWDGGDK